MTDIVIVGIGSHKNNAITTMVIDSSRSTNEHIVLDLHSLKWSLGETVRLSIASLHNQPIYPKMYYIDNFANLQPVG